MAIEIFIDGIQSNGGGVIQRCIQVSGNIECTEAVHTGLACVENVGLWRFLHPVDNPAATATSENQSIRSLQYFDPLYVIDTAIILNIVAHTIEKKVRRRILTTQCDLVSIAFPLAHSGACDIAQNIT